MDVKCVELVNFSYVDLVCVTPPPIQGGDWIAAPSSSAHFSGVWAYSMHSYMVSSLQYKILEL